ncbi:BPTI/Kunitz domain-containing protein [Neoarius graeffei]|uniref:BPTI/Kunitz domain-containing protein n=1 Tax=Neoarius graeffei TaxID=443677 RepID=UPI00298D4A33|nr:BPTI/Kunitz domain-containing protein [Neoarius graeffei]
MVSQLSLTFFLMGIMCASAQESTVKNSGCTEMMDEGTGSEKILQFYYMEDVDFCNPFFYKGEGGNGNRFTTEQQCLGNCSLKYHELYPEGDAVCTLKRDRGSCYARLVMYYYDTEQNVCRLFLYGGCQGNGNRFETKEACESMCQARSGRMLGQAPNPDEQTVDVGLIVGILGGVVFAVAVSATIALFVLRRKAKHADMKKVPTTDIEMR